MRIRGGLSKYCFSCWLILKWIVLKKYVFIIQINVLSNRRTANCKLWISGSIRSKKTLVCTILTWNELLRTCFYQKQIPSHHKFYTKSGCLKKKNNNKSTNKPKQPNILFKNLFRWWKGLLQYALNRYCIGLSRFFRLEYMWIIHFI